MAKRAILHVEIPVFIGVRFKCTRVTIRVARRVAFDSLPQESGSAVHKNIRGQEASRRFQDLLIFFPTLTRAALPRKQPRRLGTRMRFRNNVKTCSADLYIQSVYI